MTELFMTILDMSLKASFIILCVYLIRFVFCWFDLPRSYSYLLWLAVLLRLLLPTVFISEISALPEELAAGFSEKWGDDYLGETNIYWDITEEFDTAVAHGNRPVSVAGGQYVVTGSDGISPPPTVKTEVFPILAHIWLIGIVVLLAANLAAVLRLRKMLRASVPLYDNVHLCDNADTAFVVGARNPQIYLPLALTEEEIAHILHHERYHIWRKDHIWKPIAYLALCLHWFNPLVWLAFHCAMQDMELSCDEAATKNMDRNEKADYAQTLLDLTAGRRNVNAYSVSFGENDTARRIRHVLQHKTPAAIVAAVGFLLIGFSLVRFLADPPATDTPFSPGVYEGAVLDIQGSGKPMDLPQQIWFLTTENGFYASPLHSESDEKTRVGTAFPFSLTAEQMTAMLPKPALARTNIPITAITDCKIVLSEDNPNQCYLLTQHRSGSSYIGEVRCTNGTTDPEAMEYLWLAEVDPIHVLQDRTNKDFSDQSFFSCCLQDLLGMPVELFATYGYSAGREQYQITGFTVDASIGWALFRIVNESAEFTGRLEHYDAAALDACNGIIYRAPSGNITDRTAFDIVLIANPNVERVEFLLDDASYRIEPRFDRQVPWLTAIPWDANSGSETSYVFYYDANGDLAADVQTGWQHLTDDERLLVENLSEYTSIAQAWLNDPASARAEALPQGIERIEWWRGEHPMVEFYTKFTGIAPAGGYFGFYYSPDDVPLPFQNAGNLILSETDDGWAWNGGGDNRGSTKRITKYWFSFEAHF